MALSNATADAASAAFCASASITDPTAKGVWQLVFRQIWSGIKTNIGVAAVVPLNSVVTVGSAATQTGPTAPVSTTVTIT